jgi:hypothetical protein
MRGPDSSPELKSAAAQARPVVAYHLTRPEPPSAYGSQRGQTHLGSHFVIADMNLGGPEVEHAAPSPSRVFSKQDVAAMATAAHDSVLNSRSAAAQKQAFLHGSVSLF